MREPLFDSHAGIFQPRTVSSPYSLRQPTEKLLGIQDVERIRTIEGACD